MPIKRLLDGTSAADGLPRIATLRKGAPKGDGKLRDLDYFRPNFDEKFARHAPIFHQLYGERPTEFDNVYLAAPTAAEAFEYWMEERSETTLYHRCDGEKQVLWYNPNAGMYMRAKVDCLQLVHQQCVEAGHEDCPAPCACKPAGRLKVILPEFWETTGLMGYFEFITGSMHDIASIIKHLAWVERKLLEFQLGTLDAIPFVIGREPKNISRATDNGKRAKTKKNLLYVHVNEDFGKYRFLPALKALAELEPGDAPQLPEGETIDHEDEAPEVTRPLLKRRPKRLDTTEKTAKSWTQTDRWKQFREWAIMEFDLNDTKIFEALSVIQEPTVTKPSEFQGDERGGAAAIIAYALGYVGAAIIQYGDEKRVSTETIQAALYIAQTHNLREEEVSDGEFEETQEQTD